MQIAKRVERRHRNVHEVTHAAHIHQHLVGTFVSKRAAKLRNHLDHHLAGDYGGASAECQRENHAALRNSPHLLFSGILTASTMGAMAAIGGISEALCLFVPLPRSMHPALVELPKYVR